MAYFAPFIDETGMHVPLYADIRDDLISKMKLIFGSDIYIDEDSMDYQQISIFARKIFDVNMLAQLVYNNRTPITAVGVGLDNDVVYAGISRKQATSSTVQLTITGDAGTVINNGEASDGTNEWLLPSEVVIPSNGIITVEAKSKQSGNIGALPNTISKILTPTFGWLSVINNYAATPGVDVETDASLRGRFAISTQQFSQTVFESMLASIMELEAVTRVRGYENDTGAVSTGTVPANVPAGLPAHSVTFVVEGGSDVDVATEIYFAKTPGCYTNGTTEVAIESVAGNITNIRFYRPTYVNLKVKVVVKKLSSYNDEYEVKIKKQVSEYVQNMQLAENIYQSIIWSVATSAMDDITNPAYSVTNILFSIDDGATWKSEDVTVKFYEAANTTEDMVEVAYT